MFLFGKHSRSLQVLQIKQSGVLIDGGSQFSFHITTHCSYQVQRR